MGEIGLMLSGGAGQVSEGLIAGDRSAVAVFFMRILRDGSVVGQTHIGYPGMYVVGVSCLRMVAG